MFIVLVNYVQPLEKVEQFLGEHVAFLERYYEQRKFIVSGRRIPRVGGVILVNASSEDEVKHIISEDPFHQHGIAEYDIIEFTPTKCDPEFSPFAVLANG